MERAASLPPRRTSSPVKKAPQTRPRLHQYHTLEHAVSLFQNSKNIIVLTGAGISTSLGVPDFRSSTGVYNLLENSKYSDPQELFHIENFTTDPSEFFKQAAKVFPRMQGLVSADGRGGSTKSADAPMVPRYSLTHAFIALLQSKGKLLTNYTQNIDGLEIAAGVSSSRLIQCHGTLATATCMSCGKQTTARKYMPVVRAGGIPVCKCSQYEDPKPSKHRGRSGKKKKRKRDEFEDDSEDDEVESFPKGLLKPDMTFFGEKIANSYAPRLEIDKHKVDLLVIIGTSLQVEPVNSMLLAVPASVPQIWISKDRCQREGVKVDIELLGECDLVLEEIARQAGWEGSLKQLLWTIKKSPADSKISSAKPDIVTKQVKKGKPSSPVKIEEPLQLRHRVNDAVDLRVKPTIETVVKVNGEAIDHSTATDTAHTDSTRVSDDKNGSKEPPKLRPVNGHGVGDESERLKAKKEPTSLSPSKVIIELEEGTRSRYYIRRAK